MSRYRMRPRKPRDEPSIQFTTIPPAAVGGSERVAPIGGRATGIRPGQRIVIYTKSGVWWVQPLTSEPFTTVGPDGTWENTIHLGMEYAALLVDDGYRPANTRDALPPLGGGVIAIASVKGTGDLQTRASKVLTFSGYEWDVRSIPSDRGGPNDYDPDNAWTDAEGLLHLKLAKRDGRWTSAEVILKRGLGHGTYSFTVRDVSGLDPSAALGLLTWDTEGVEQNHRELDVEISRWGDLRDPQRAVRGPALLRGRECRAVHGAAGYVDAFVPMGTGTCPVQNRPRRARNRRRAGRRP